MISNELCLYKMCEPAKNGTNRGLNDIGTLPRFRSSSIKNAVYAYWSQIGGFISVGYFGKRSTIHTYGADGGPKVHKSLLSSCLKKQGSRFV